VTFPIGIGREGWSTPLGKPRIVDKTKDPYWVVPDSILQEHAARGDPLPNVVPPGPENPLGRYSLRLGFPGYLIHGSNRSFGVGTRISHGCIRLYDDDIEYLYRMVPIDTPLRVVNQPYKAGWQGRALFVEAHQPLAEQLREQGPNFTPLVEAIVDALGERGAQVDWDTARRIAGAHTGIPTEIIVRYPVQQPPERLTESASETQKPGSP